MTKQELISLCLTFPAAYEDYPFDDSTTVIRHKTNKKMFALISEKDGRLYINLKCEPVKAELLRRVHEGAVEPGWHMNKAHWNTVWADGGVPLDELTGMIEDSFGLIKPKERKQND